VDSHFEVKTADQEPFLISEKGKKLEKTGTTLRRRKKKRTKALNSSENKESTVQQVEQDEKPLSFVNLAANELVVKAFKEYLLTAGDPVALNKFLLWSDIRTIESENNPPTKATQATQIQIHQDFYKKSRSKEIDLPSALKARLNVKLRPSAAILSAVQEHLAGSIQLKFDTFLQTLAVSQSCQAIETVSTLQMLLQKRRKPRRAPVKAMPTPELHAELEAVLSAVDGPLPHKMDSFRSYLKLYGPSEGCPLAENNLTFWIETAKLKAMCQSVADKAVLRMKAAVMVECYLDCSNTPSLQVDLPNEFADRLLNSIRGSLLSSVKPIWKSLNAQLLDEAQVHVLKELVPFWAGFVKWYKPPGASTTATGKFHRMKNRRRKQKIVVMKVDTVSKTSASSVCKRQSSTTPSILRCSLPPVPSSGSNSFPRQLTFSLTSGAYWKAMAANDRHHHQISDSESLSMN
jgi:hypothetical protein